MARPVVWTLPALDDIDSIASFIARDSLQQAARVVAQTYAAADSVADFPEAARIVPECENPNIRERFVYSYRLIYRIEADFIRIEAVIHGARLFAAVEERFL